MCCKSLNGPNGVLLNGDLIGDSAGFSGTITDGSRVNYGGDMIGSSGVFTNGDCDYVNFENSATNDSTATSLSAAAKAAAEK